MNARVDVPFVKTDPRQGALKKYLTHPGVMAAMSAVLPKLAAQVGTTPDRIIGAALVATAKNPDLLKCSPESILRSLLECAQLGLTPGGVLGEAYLIPYGGECTLQIGVKGYQRLAFDAGRVKKIEGRVVYAAELSGRCGGKFSVMFEPVETIEHVPAFGSVEEMGPIVAAYAKFTFSDANPQYELLRRPDLEAIRRQADTKRASPAWRDWPDQMAIKSAIKRGVKRVDISPTSPLARAVEVDNRAEDGTQHALADIDLPAADAQELLAAQAQVPADPEPVEPPAPTGHAALGLKGGRS